MRHNDLPQFSDERININSFLRWLEILIPPEDQDGSKPEDPNFPLRPVSCPFASYVLRINQQFDGAQEISFLLIAAELTRCYLETIAKQYSQPSRHLLFSVACYIALKFVLDENFKDDYCAQAFGYPKEMLLDFEVKFLKQIKFNFVTQDRIQQLWKSYKLFHQPFQQYNDLIKIMISKLNEYTGYGCRAIRILCGMWNRHHIAAVSRIILELKNESIDSISRFQSAVDQLGAISRAKGFNKNGALSRTIDQIRAIAMKDGITMLESTQGVTPFSCSPSVV